MGILNINRENPTQVTFSFIPEINEIKLENYKVAVKAIHKQSAVYIISSDNAEVVLNLYFEETYFTYKLYFEQIRAHP